MTKLVSIRLQDDDYNKITKYYEMKKQANIEGDGAKRSIAKLFLNSLYGKILSKINEGD